jgi:hypothetical protein
MCLSILRFIHKVSNIFTIISHRDSHFASQWAAGTQQAKKKVTVAMAVTPRKDIIILFYYSVAL